jgi:hypothetical protein
MKWGKASDKKKENEKLPSLITALSAIGDSPRNKHQMAIHHIQGNN